jgi:hypothetical protein
MPWSIQRKDDEWCVIKDSDGSSAGCHATRERALKQQRALYAQESQTASVEENGSPMRVEIAPAEQNRVVEEALVASLGEMSKTLEQVVGVLGKIVDTQNEDREAFTHALTAAANRPEPEAPVVNVYVPEIVIPDQPPATVNVHVPKTKLLIPAAPAPVVNVTLPGSKKTVKFTRNLNGEVESADIVEELDGG